MLGMMVAWALLAQDKPLAGSLPPLPPPDTSTIGNERGPRRGPLFISPMGEPFRGRDPVRQWFDGADGNHDGAVTMAEFVADAARFFDRLDRGHDGEIDPDDIEYYETMLAPEIRTGGEGMASARSGSPRGDRGGGRGRGGGSRDSGGGGGRYGGGGRAGGGPSSGANGAGGNDQRAARYDDTRRGAARFGFFDYPEPVTAADANLNRGVDAGEFRSAAIERFAMLDKNHDGKLTFGELPPLPSSAARGGGDGPSGGRFGRGGRDTPPDAASPQD